MSFDPSFQPGFHNPVREAQETFRAAMNAMAQPGRRVGLALGVTRLAPLSASAAALLLTLADFETSLWLDPPARDRAGLADFLRFHTGVRLVEAPEEADFALITEPLRMPPLAAFAQGTLEYPDRSTTLVIQVDAFRDHGWRLEGPGIRGQIGFCAEPLPEGFVRQVEANRSRFPCGVDLIFVTEGEIAALPRSVRLQETS